MIGQVLGPYRVLSKLGEGGMGQVYRARDTQLDRDVALKVLPDAFADDAERLHRFEREAKALAALNHPNIAQVFGIVSADPSTSSGQGRRAPAIAMEFVDGGGLDEIKSAMPLDELLPILRQIAAALEAAHDSGIIHRDLKPANIKLRDDGTVKVLDFGLAKALDARASGATAETSSPTITSPATGLGIILGTAAYMSPEQARGKVVDKRADIWAFGVVAFELVTGSRLFVGETVSDTIAAVLRQDVPWDRLPPNTPPRLQRLLRHCLDRDPRNRLKDAGDVRIEIDDIISAPAGDGPVAQATAAPTPVKSRTAERLVWAALVLTAIGATWWLAASKPTETETPWSQVTQITDEAGRESSPSIAPDGDSIAYESNAAGNWDIYVRRIGGRNATAVAGDPARHEGAPAFSPDGKSIAFHEVDTDGGIFVVGATGESERRISDAGFHPAWSPDGRSIAFCQERIVLPQSRAIVSSISVVDITTGAVRVLIKGDGVQPAWSPSGARLAYWANTSGQRDIYTISATGGEPTKVTDDPELDWSVVWAPDGRHLYFASDRGGTFNLWRIAVDESTGRVMGPPEPVTVGVGATVASPSFSRDGLKLVFGSINRSINPVALSLSIGGAGGERVGEPRFLFRQAGTFVPTSVSPDGTTLAISGAARTEDIWVSRTDGTGLRRLNDDAHRDRIPMWVDDNELLFYSNRNGKYEVWSIRKDGSGLTQRSTSKESMNWAFPDPAGRRIWAFGAGQTYTFPLGQKTPQPVVAMPPIAVEGGFLRVHGITRDGKRLAGIALSPAGARLGVGWHNLETGETWVSREGSDFGLPAWLDEQRVVFVVDGTLALIDTAKRRRIIGGPFPFEVNAAVMPAVSPDHRTIFVGAGTTEADVWMVERKK